MTLSLKRDLEVKKGAAVIDIETEPIKDSPLKHLRIKTIQVDNEHFSSVELKRPRVLRVFSREKWIAYNAPPGPEDHGPPVRGPRAFEQTQLTRNGYEVWKNEDGTKKEWKDV